MPGWTRRGTIAGLVAASALPPAFARTATARDFHDLAPRPPMGWNSWDSFAATINEAQARETAAIMRSEDRRVGKECVRTCKSRWLAYQYKKKKKRTRKTTK